jgi:hypothetical protein
VGFVPQTPHPRPTAKRIRNFAREMRHKPTDAEAVLTYRRDQTERYRQRKW